MKYIIIFILGYFIGNISSSYIVGKLAGNVDIRNHGSGNLGATNTFRVLGLKAGIGAFAGDFLKGVVATLIGIWIGGDIGGMVGGLAAVLGHNWPVFLGFKGGKGIASSLGLIFVLFPSIGAILITVGIVIIALCRYVSLASITGSIMFPVLVALFRYDLIYVILSIVMGAIAIYRHRGNIERLLKGNENKISFNIKGR